MFINKEFRNVSIFSDENPNPVLAASKEGKIFYANSAGLRLLNFWNCRANQILPEPWLKLVNDALSSGSTMTSECKFGPGMYFFSFAPITGKGYVTIYGVDITQRKRIEQELLQSKKLQAMDVMTKWIAHEFNNIFAIIDGKIQILMRENKGSGKLMDELRFIRKSVTNGAEIIHRMNKFAKRISFPAAKESMDIPANAPEQCRARSEKKGRKNRILIVDDEEAIGNVLHEFLSEEGYKVVFINSGAAALELLKKDEFDLVLCDLGMPDVSGWDILNVIDTMAKKPKVGIITGFLNTSDVFPGKELKSDFVINKPFELDDVLRSVNNSLKD